MVTLIAYLVLAPNASAEEVCTFSPPPNGGLEPKGSPLPTQLISTSSPEFAVSVTVTCTKSATLTVLPLTQAEGPSNSGSSAVATVASPFGSTSSNGGTSINLPLGATPLEINLEVNNNSVPLKAGNYKYIVRLKTTP
ncbi:MAG: hypothetical protein KME23_29375 [Goleter apudmare HA4340-LM2]|nr:hypothetical protein [Goleter apudmare HA4340-LM2]